MQRAVCVISDTMVTNLSRSEATNVRTTSSTQRCLQAKFDKRKARSVCDAFDQLGHWAGDCLVNIVGLEDEVQKFKTQECDKSCQCKLMFLMCVSWILHTSCVRNEFRGCWTKRRSPRSLKRQPDTQYPTEPRTRAYRQICIERSIGHAISVAPESEVHGFGNGGLLTSTERVTVPVVLADHPLLLSYSVVESPVLSLLIGRDVVEGLGLDIKGSSKTLENNGRSQPLEDSVATLSLERHASLLKLKHSPDPPTSRLRPRPTSFVPRSKKSRLTSTLEVCLPLCSGKIWTAQA